MKKFLDIGVDIGGTKTAFALVDAKGQIINKDSFPTKPENGFRAFSLRLCAELNNFIKQSPAPVRGIGIGVPCGNSVTGCIESPVHLNWGDVHLVNVLSSSIKGLPIFITNDANAAALGEKAYGVAKKMDNFIVLTLGTGVGSGIFVHGKLVTGHRGMAGELGHLRYAACGDRLCSCGRKGCLDAWCSSKGILRTYNELLKDAGKEPVNEQFTSYDLYLLANEGNELAKKAFDITGEVLGSAIADIVTFSQPEAVILFGGLAQSGSLLLDPAKRSFEANTLPMFSGTPIMLSTIHAEEASLLGAAALNNSFFLTE